MKIYNLILTIVLILAITLTSTAQDNIKQTDLPKLVGNWAYANEDMNFRVELFSKKVNINNNLIEYLFGYSKLEKNGVLVYDNFELLQSFKNRDSLSFNELRDATRAQVSPEVSVNFASSEHSAVFYLPSISEMVKFSIKYDHQKDEMVWMFDYFINNQTKNDPNHFPAVPSTWVLKRVE